MWDPELIALAERLRSIIDKYEHELETLKTVGYNRSVMSHLSEVQRKIVIASMMVAVQSKNSRSW